MSLNMFTVIVVRGTSLQMIYTDALQTIPRGYQRWMHECEDAFTVLIYYTSV